MMGVEYKLNAARTGWKHVAQSRSRIAEEWGTCSARVLRWKLAACIIAVIGAMVIALPLRADDGSGSELIRPYQPAAPHAPKITYKLSDGSDKWDPDARARIVKAMDAAVAIYNKYGQFDRVLTANWNPGTPTADANFGGWINFGGQIGARTAQHEIAHTLGVGTAPKWEEFAKTGIWTGKYAIAQLKQLDGPNAILHCDHQHFWPYGLNYEEEGNPATFRGNVLMVTALRADMGLGPPPHPAADALRQAQADAQVAHDAADKAQHDLQVLCTERSSGLANQPDVAAATKALTDARTASEGATNGALQKVHGSAKYRAARLAADQAQQKMDALRDDQSADSSAMEAAAKAALDAKSAMSRLESDALASDANVSDARAKYAAARTKLDSVRADQLRNDPQLIADQNAVSAARTRAASADQAVAVAEKAAQAEAADQAQSATGANTTPQTPQNSGQ